MEDLKYTSLEDIKDFLQTLNYKWNGEIYFAETTNKAHIEHFRYTTKLVVKNLETKKDEILSIAISDAYFHIIKNNSKIKYDIIDHTIAWQVFMLDRKPKTYARFLYNKALSEIHKIEHEFESKINLIKKQTEQLVYEKSLKSATLNTTLYNAKHKLTTITKTNKTFKDNNL